MSAPSHPSLPDQAERDRFRRRLDRNFSVIAPAGVGKTTAIVDRIAAIADRDEQEVDSLLKSLAVVTYTKKAAAEMSERARQRLAGGGPRAADRLAAFNGAFFGTIHSFCLELLRRWGHVLGLPPELRVAADKEALWNSFLSGQDSLLGGLPESMRAELARYVDLRDLCELARKWPLESTPPPQPEEVPPEPDLGALLSYEAPRKNSVAVVERHQQLLRKWLDKKKLDDEWLGLPERSTEAREFKTLWQAVFSPLRDWLAQATAVAAADLARRFRAYRLEQGEVFYEDMVSLCCELMRHPEAGRDIRAQGFHIILDEAQDTDPAQFEVLLAVAQSPEASGNWREGNLPPPGRYCMVGDPQQSIYADRADIATYLAVHEALVAAPGGEEATFQVTMRCDEAVVAWVNASGPAALHGAEGQVSLVALEAKPEAGPGAVQALRLEPESPPDARKTNETARQEARLLADWLKKSTPGDFGVKDWSQIALLCPRRNRLEDLAEALAVAGLPYQNHSGRNTRGEDPAYAWAAGLAAVMADPGNAFELAGVLRELYGLSDGELAAQVEASGTRGPWHPLSLALPPRCGGQVQVALEQLHGLRRELMELPLRTGFARMIEAVDLPGRLASIGAGVEALDILSTEAAVAEEAGEGWVEFAQRLRSDYTSEGGEADPEPGKIQLLTCHKAKGLEWPVVILPFLFSPLGSPNMSYPQPLAGPGGALTLALDSDHETGEAKTWQGRRDRHALERLLYVAMTRPRQRLILVDDEAFFPKGRDSFAECLRLREDEENRSRWLELSPWKATTDTKNHQKETKSLPDAPSKVLAEALLVLSPSYIRRVLPSSLARHEAGHGHERSERDRLAEPEYPEVAHSSSGGTGYGNWWHGVMETLSWEKSVEAWREQLRAALPACPDPIRGEAEIERFLESDLAGLLASAEVVRTEIPVLWRASEAEAYDGSIDLTARLPGGGWLLVDWKTDRVGKNPTAELLAAYGPQLAAYRSALLAIFGSDVRALLYSTRAALAAVLP